MRQQSLVDGHGQPINADSAYAAASWLTLLMSDEVSEKDKSDWQQWRTQSDDNERAWRHIESICAGFKQIDGSVAHKSLSSLKDPGRRTLLKLVATLCLTGGGLEWGRQNGGWQTLAADYRTGTGEQRQVTLSEGSQLLLDTQTALNVQYDEHQRQIELLSGDLLITTGQQERHQANPRPFSIITPHGRILALGTRFRVQLLEEQTRVAVYQGAVCLSPQDGRQISPRIEPGQGGWLNEEHYGEIHQGEVEPGWVQGKLLADDMSLGDFLRALNRYRSGAIRCDEDIASLRLSGVFLLADTDKILDILPTILPVKINRLSKYWVSLSAK
ncbi:FecR domain-containing protein [Klebsiella sp. BIGb0407]|uniref:FecR domain-containing protein n=1 Tax=Klebsiella sp. BIGb0407 TaxID=2940603 RepID=UPI0021678D49|nr:FecR domain-containing protein [Klebsiella sp. BIGb0407]MCS3433868.1 transmembrane sensor [Klebsiella sp. BIGb0407]